MLGLYYSPHWIFDILWIHMFTYVWFLLVQVGWRGAEREERVIMFLHFLPDHFRGQDIIIINIWYSSFYIFVLFLLLEPRTFISSLLRKINLHPGKQQTYSYFIFLEECCCFTNIFFEKSLVSNQVLIRQDNL